jgi:hypothetical protein
MLFPGATQHAAKRSSALQTRGSSWFPEFFNDPGSAPHRFALHRVREKRLTRGNDG